MPTKVCSVRFTDNNRIKVVNHQRNYTVFSARYECTPPITRRRYAHLFATAVAILGVYMPFLGNK